MKWLDRFKNRIKRMSIRRKILVFYLALVLVSILISVSIYYSMSNRYLDTTIYDLSVNEAEAYSKSVELLIEDINSYSKEIISSVTIQAALDPKQEGEFNLQRVDQELASSIAFNNKVSSVYVFDFEGRKYYRDKQIFKNLQLEDIQAKSWYQDLVEKKGGFIYNFNGDGLIDDEEYDYLSVFRIINSNVDYQPIGVMMVNVDHTRIKELFNVGDDNLRMIRLREMTYGTEVLCTDPLTESVMKGETTFANDQETFFFDMLQNRIVNEMDNVQKVLSSEGVYYSKFNVSNSDFHMTGLVNDKHQWQIIDVKPGRDRSSMISLFNVTIVFVVLINAVFIIYGSFLFAKYFTSSITALTKSMRAVEEGVFTPVEVDTNHDEIGTLKEGYNYMIIEIQRLIQEVIEEQQVIKEAELRVIMEQIKPHFIYNTLDSISSLMYLGRTEDANTALGALAKFYRRSLSDGRSVVTLKTEIDIIKNYMLIQDIRYQDLFDFQMEVDESVMDIRVPKLLLQPLVENALYHGIRPMGDGGIIRVAAFRQSEAVVIEVADNGMGMAAETIDKVFREAYDKEKNMSSIGLPATIRRISHLYGDRCHISINNESDGTLIRIVLDSQKAGE